MNHHHHYNHLQLSLSLLFSDEPARKQLKVNSSCKQICRRKQMHQQQEYKLSRKGFENGHYFKRLGCECFYNVSDACHKKTMMIIYVWTALMIILANFIPGAQSVDCFKCSSRNGSNPECEDPFHNLKSARVTTPILPDPSAKVIYHAPCYAGRKGREGLFPASACIKLTGTFARMSHCGKFQFEGDLLKGCVMACPEDACNSATSTRNIVSPGGQCLIQIILCLISSLICAKLLANPSVVFSQLR